METTLFSSVQSMIIKMLAIIVIIVLMIAIVITMDHNDCHAVLVIRLSLLYITFVMIIDRIVVIVIAIIIIMVIAIITMSDRTLTSQILSLLHMCVCEKAYAYTCARTRIITHVHIINILEYCHKHITPKYMYNKTRLA